MYVMRSRSLGLWALSCLAVAHPTVDGSKPASADPTPKGFPLPMPQQIVFGEPLLFPQTAEPSKEELATAHEAFIAALVALFDKHKAEYGCAGRTLEVI